MLTSHATARADKSHRSGPSSRRFSSASTCVRGEHGEPVGERKHRTTQRMRSRAPLFAARGLAVRTVVLAAPSIVPTRLVGAGGEPVGLGTPVIIKRGFAMKPLCTFVIRTHRQRGCADGDRRGADLRQKAREAFGRASFELAPARQRTDSAHTPAHNSLTQLSRASTQAREPRLALINARVHTRSPFSALASTSIRSTLSHTPPQNARALSLTSQEDDIATHLSLSSLRLSRLYCAHSPDNDIVRVTRRHGHGIQK